MNKYLVRIFYRENYNVDKLYKIEFKIMALNWHEAEHKALKAFYSYLNFNHANWIRVVDKIKIYKKIGDRYLNEEDISVLTKKFLLAEQEELKEVVEQIYEWEVIDLMELVYNRLLTEDNEKNKEYLLFLIYKMKPKVLPSLKKILLNCENYLNLILDIASYTKFSDGKEVLIQLLQKVNDSEELAKILLALELYKFEENEILNLYEILKEKMDENLEKQFCLFLIEVMDIDRIKNMNFDEDFKNRCLKMFLPNYKEDFRKNTIIEKIKKWFKW